jgi:hypothetical protein
VNFSQQQVIAWLPSGHTICSTEIVRGKPKIVTFFQKTPLWPSLIQSPFLHRLFRQSFNPAVIRSAGSATRSGPLHRHNSEKYGARYGVPTRLAAIRMIRVSMPPSVSVIFIAI